MKSGLVILLIAEYQRWMRKLLASIGTAALSALVCSAGELPDFAKVPRQIAKAPNFVAADPLYGLFLFGKQADKPVWAILDKSAKAAPGYDVLYLDANGDGDLTQAGERFESKAVLGSDNQPTFCAFQIGMFKEPGSDRVHTEFKLSWWPTRVSYSMKWLGGKPTLGCYGPTPTSYGHFGKSPETAPIIVPGHDLPFQFEHWMSDALQRGGQNDFKVFAGNAGSAPGMFSCVDDEFLPRDGKHFVVATLIYRDSSGAEKQKRYELRDRC